MLINFSTNHIHSALSRRHTRTISLDSTVVAVWLAMLRQKQHDFLMSTSQTHRCLEFERGDVALEIDSPDTDLNCESVELKQQKAQPGDADVHKTVQEI